jgi:hypothetical protein
MRYLRLVGIIAVAVAVQWLLRSLVGRAFTASWDKWPLIDGKVTRTFGKATAIQVFFKWEVAGRTYEGDAAGGTVTDQAGRQFLANWKDSTVRVRYNPARPSSGVVRPEDQPERFEGVHTWVVGGVTASLNR